MPSRLSYDKVRDEIESKGCKLLSKEYKNIKSHITYLCRCGHERTSNFTTFRALVDYKCFECVNNGGGKAGHLNNTNLGMHYKVFKARLRVMETLYSRTHKYRNDFLPENYDKVQLCYKCKRGKSLFFFPIDVRYESNHRTICKSCNKMEHDLRRLNHTQDQHIQEIITTSKASSREREKKGREECGENTLTKEDIYDLLEEQGGRCYYSGRELVFEYNNSNKISIDRIESEKGYTKDNVRLVCWVVNQAKSDSSHEEFLEMCRDIERFHR